MHPLRSCAGFPPSGRPLDWVPEHSKSWEYLLGAPSRYRTVLYRSQVPGRFSLLLTSFGKRRTEVLLIIPIKSVARRGPCFIGRHRQPDSGTSPNPVPLDDSASGQTL